MPSVGELDERKQPDPILLDLSLSGGGRDADLREIRREIAETHAIATRTANSVATLAGSLKEVLGRQDRQERTGNLNSFVAYVLFTALLGGGFALLYRARANQLVAERADAVRRRDDAIDEATAARKELATRDDAARKAADFYALLSDGKRADAIGRYPEIAAERLTPVEAQVFQDGVTKARAELVETAWNAGTDAFKQEQWKRASVEIRKALSFAEDGARAPEMRYTLGIALVKLGDYAGAAKELESALGGGVEHGAGADARFYYATALEALRQEDRARTEYAQFADGHEDSPLAGTARRKVAELTQHLANSP
jgi:TolA-binding protein